MTKLRDFFITTWNLWQFLYTQNDSLPALCFCWGYGALIVSIDYQYLQLRMDTYVLQEAKTW